MQYDLLAQVYNTYRVFETHVELTFSNPDRDGAYVGYRVRNSANPILTDGQTLGRIMEMDHTEVAPLNNTGSQVKTFKFGFRTAAMAGCSEVQAEDWDMDGTFSGSVLPGISTVIEPFCFHSTVGENNTVFYTIRITYIGDCIARKTYPAS